MMKKKRLQLLGMAALLLIFVIAFFGLKKYNAKQEEKEAQETTDTIQIISEDLDEVVALSYDYNGDQVNLVKENGTWYLEGDREASLKQSTINQMLYYLAPMSAVARLDAPKELSEYGLDTPSQTIRMKTASAEYTLLVGDCNDITGYFYLKKDGDGDVYTVAYSVAYACAYTSEELIETPEEETAGASAEESAEETAEVSAEESAEETAGASAEESAEETNAE